MRTKIKKYKQETIKMILPTLLLNLRRRNYLHVRLWKEKVLIKPKKILSSAKFKIKMLCKVYMLSELEKLSKQQLGIISSWSFAMEAI